VAFATILHIQTLATCQATNWLVVTRPAAVRPSSILSQAFHQSNFAILATYMNKTICGTSRPHIKQDFIDKNLYPAFK